MYRTIVLLLAGMAVSSVSMAGGADCRVRMSSAARMFVEVSGAGFVVPEDQADAPAVSTRMVCTRMAANNGCTGSSDVVAFGVGDSVPVTLHVFVRARQVSQTDECVIHSIEWDQRAEYSAPASNQPLYPAP